MADNDNQLTCDKVVLQLMKWPFWGTVYVVYIPSSAFVCFWTFCILNFHFSSTGWPICRQPWTATYKIFAFLQQQQQQRASRWWGRGVEFLLNFQPPCVLQLQPPTSLGGVDQVPGHGFWPQVVFSNKNCINPDFLLRKFQKFSLDSPLPIPHFRRGLLSIDPLVFFGQLWAAGTN